MTLRTLLITSLLATGLVTTVAGESQLEETRQVLQKLVEQRQKIADEQSQWLVQEQSLLDSIALLELEIELLEERIEVTEAESTQAERDRIRLNGQIEELKEASAVVATVIRGMEQRVLSLVNALPVEIKDKLARLTKRIPKRNEAESSIQASLSERMQNVVGVLTQIEVFNNGIHVLSENKEKNGQTVTVSVLYIGLAQAYYVNSDQGIAGYGSVDTESGWTWTQDDSLVGVVSKAIDVYESNIPAEFVVLPTAQ